MKHKSLFFQEGQRISGFLALLMRLRNGGEKWTREEKQQIKKDLKVLVMYIPALIIFLLPGGSLLIPLLAEVMDRRKVPRWPASQRHPKGVPEGEDNRASGGASKPSP